MCVCACVRAFERVLACVRVCARAGRECVCVYGCRPIVARARISIQ